MVYGRYWSHKFTDCPVYRLINCSDDLWIFQIPILYWGQNPFLTTPVLYCVYQLQYQLFIMCVVL